MLKNESRGIAAEGRTLMAGIISSSRANWASSVGQRTNPNTRRRRLAQMKRLARDLEGQGFVILAFGHAKLGTRMQLQLVQKFQKARIFFIYTNHFRAILGVQVGQQDRSLFAQLRRPTAQGQAVRTGFFTRESLQQERFDLG